MKQILLTCLVLLLCRGALAQQTTTDKNWDSLKMLAGTWVGEGSAEHGPAGSGTVAFEPALQGKVLVRKNHAEYPATKDRPAVSHDDLMIIYPDQNVKQIRAFYTDTEGHVIYYTASVSGDGKTIVFLSDKDAAAPLYRLTYVFTAPNKMLISFEAAPPGNPDRFQKFLDGTVRRVTQN